MELDITNPQSAQQMKTTDNGPCKLHVSVVFNAMLYVIARAQFRPCKKQTNNAMREKETEISENRAAKWIVDVHKFPSKFHGEIKTLCQMATHSYTDTRWICNLFTVPIFSSDPIRWCASQSSLDYRKRNDRGKSKFEKTHTIRNHQRFQVIQKCVSLAFFRNWIFDAPLEIWIWISHIIANSLHKLRN